MVIASRPIFLFSIYFFLIHFLTPLYKASVSRFRYQAEYDELAMIYNALLSVLVYILAYIISEYTGKNKKKVILMATEFRGAKDAMFVGVLLYAIGFYFSWEAMGAITHSIGVEEFMSDRIAGGSQLGLGQHFSNLLIIGSVIFFAGWLNSRRLLRLVGLLGSIAMIAYSFSYFGLLSSRNSILIVIIFHITIFAFYRPTQIKGSTKGIRYILLFLAIAIGLVFAGHQTTVARYTDRGGWHAQQQLENVWYTLLDGTFGNDENLLWLLENDHEYYFGFTYLAGFVNLIPSALWPEKPWGAGPEIRNMIYPGTYVKGGLHNSSITTGLLTEARMNFGLLGMLVAVFLWAKISKFFFWRILASTHIVSQTAWLVSGISLSTMLMYSEFLGFFGRFIFLFVPPFVLLMLVRILKQAIRLQAKNM
ncbi:O-antigen polymerase [Nitrosomonas sp. Nm58]|uniref:O-antigen polymerase n=1 Tax=Nitrosomonas sp. Nm58 TaxID=200126 RepID=UPI000B809B08|nr:O-antigen polymerase [Nitrosomonas sp. Nm58]